jgi:hypothetical protein
MRYFKIRGRMAKQDRKQGNALYGILIGVVVVFIVAVSSICWWQNDIIKSDIAKIDDLKAQLASRPVTEYTSTKGVKVKVVTAKQSTGHFVVAGLVPGNWSFEASFPVQLRNSGGSVIAQQAAHVDGEWMTSEIQPFTVLLTYSAAAGSGTLVLQKDNPSGLPANDDSVSIPVDY